MEQTTQLLTDAWGREALETIKDALTSALADALTADGLVSEDGNYMPRKMELLQGGGTVPIRKFSALWYLLRFAIMRAVEGCGDLRTAAPDIEQGAAARFVIDASAAAVQIYGTEHTHFFEIN